MDMRKSGVVSGSDSGAFTDLNRLNNLKVGDRESDGNMRKVAQEFESLFLNEMLKSMRSANEVLGKDNPLNTPAAKQYQEMYDQQLSVTLSRQGGGIGLADVLMRQMSKNKAAVPGEAAATTALTAEVKAPAAATVDSPFVREIRVEMMMLKKLIPLAFLPIPNFLLHILFLINLNLLFHFSHSRSL